MLMSERVSIVDNQQKQGACPFNHENLTEEQIAQLKSLPGSDGLPFVGETLNFISNPSGFASQMTEKYGSPFYANVLGKNTIFFSGTEANRFIFAGENKYLQNNWSKPIRQLLGKDSVSMLSGENHRKRRAVLNPYFRYDRMDAFIPTIRTTIETHLEKWATSGEMTLSMANRDLTFEIIARYIFGETDGLPVSELRDEFLTWTRGIFTMGIDLPFTRFGKAMQARERLWAKLTAIVEEYRKKDLSDCVLKSLFELRDEDGHPFSTSTIVDEIQVLLFAGHDTTVSALTNTLVLLAQHPGVVEKARQEQAEIDDNNLDTSKGLKNYPYLDAIINEGLRMHAPVTGAFRQMTGDRCLAGYHIPKDWAISVPIAGTLRNSDLWENSDTFDPGRFMRDEHKKEALMFIPFGGGPRLCLGQNFALIVMRLTLALLFKDYSWELKPDQDLEVSILPTPLPKDGGLVTFRKLD